MIASRSLTISGANFLRKALDPFHDFEVRLDGIPDSNTSSVVVQEINISKQFIAPATTTGTWDIHFATLPELGTINYRDGTANAGFCNATGYTQVSGGTRTMSLLSVSAVQSGQPTFPNGVTLTGANYTDYFDLSPYLLGQKRILGFAFEVHDTTAELYKQGTCTVYRIPQTVNLGTMFYDTATFASGSPAGGYSVPVFSKISRLPPTTLAEAMLLPTSRQWESDKGCMVVGTQDIKSADLAGATYEARVFTKGDLGPSNVYASFQYPSGYSSDGLFTNNNTRIVPVGFNFQTASHPVPIHTSGAYFTGLNASSTLTVTLKVILESCPTPDNTQLVVLAKPSPDYDPVALELYKAVITLLPPGCPVGDNASGDFWDRVLGLIKDVAPIIGSAIPYPGAAMIGNVASRIAEVAQNKRNSSSKSNVASDRKQILGSFGASGAKNSVPKKK